MRKKSAILIIEYFMPSPQKRLSFWRSRNTSRSTPPVYACPL